MPNGTEVRGTGPASQCGWGLCPAALRRRGGRAILAVLATIASGAGAQEVALGAPELVLVPSGQELFFLDTVQSAPGPDGLAIRFRFVAPAIARDTGTIGAEAAQSDMEWLCNNVALPRLPTTGPMPSQIIVSLSDRKVAFGAAAPEATQYFEAFTVADGRCVWEAF